jgi:signal transduction histidine kinase
MNRILTLTLFILFSFKSYSSDVVILSQDKQETDLNSSLYNYTPNGEIGIQDILRVQDWRKLPPNGSMLGLSKNTEWIRVNLRYNGTDSLNRVLYFSYPMIKEIDVYFVADGKVLKQRNLGTTRNKYNSDFQNRGFSVSLSIPPNQDSYLFIRLNNNYRWLRAPMFLMSDQQLLSNISVGENLIWFWRGIFVFAVMLSILLYLKVRLKLFLYYLVANIGFLLFIGTEIGDFSKLVDIDPSNNTVAFNHLGSIIAIYFFPLFLNEMVAISTVGPKLWKWTFHLLHLTWLLIAITTIPFFRDTMLLYFTTLTLIIASMLVTFMQTYLLFLVMRKNGGYSTLVFLIYFFYTIGVYLNAFLPSLGFITDTPITFYSLLLVSSFEIISFLFLISNEALNTYKERAVLLKKIQSHQKDLVAAIVKSQEEERNSIGRELHDLIGANLSIMKQKVGSVNVELEKIIVNSIDAVRRLSHGLSTPKVEENEFKDEVIQLCNLFQTEERSIKPYFHKWPIFKNKEITTNIFRICQELLQNANKHSSAKNVFLQFIGEEGNKCSIIYEDDGVGFEYPHRKSTGLGIRNIENRVSLINGSIQYDTSSKAHGTTIFIEF